MFSCDKNKYFFQEWIVLTPVTYLPVTLLNILFLSTDNPFKRRREFLRMDSVPKNFKRQLEKYSHSYIYYWKIRCRFL